MRWLSSAGVLETSSPIVGSFPACCARAASGHAAAPPSSVMNSAAQSFDHLVGAGEYSVEALSRPSAFAVLRLITSSYLVGACTGRSAGFSPLRIRSTYSAARR